MAATPLKPSNHDVGCILGVGIGVTNISGAQRLARKLGISSIPRRRGEVGSRAAMFSSSTVGEDRLVLVDSVKVLSSFKNAVPSSAIDSGSSKYTPLSWIWVLSGAESPDVVGSMVAISNLRWLAFPIVVK